MSDYFNDQGEPMITASQARIEFDLDQEFDLDAYYDRQENDDHELLDPSDHDHSDYMVIRRGMAECPACETDGKIIEKDDQGWAVKIIWEDGTVWQERS